MLRFNIVLSSSKNKDKETNYRMGQSGLGTLKHFKNSPKVDDHYYF